MIYKVGTFNDMKKLPSMDAVTQGVILNTVKILCDNYGIERNIDEDDGGYVLYCEPGTTLSELESYFDYEDYKYNLERVFFYENAGPSICDALFIVCCDFAVSIVMSMADAPIEWLEFDDGV